MLYFNIKDTALWQPLLIFCPKNFPILPSKIALSALLHVFAGVCHTICAAL